MSTIRISVAELRSKMRDFTPEEKARLDAMSDDEIERQAAADPDALPPTEEMMRRGQAYRRHRLFSERLRAEWLGASLSEAKLDSDLPVWEVIDRNGRRVFLQAADVRRVNLPCGASARIVALEAAEPHESTDVDAAHAGSPERQAT